MTKATNCHRPCALERGKVKRRKVPRRNQSELIRDELAHADAAAVRKQGTVSSAHICDSSPRAGALDPPSWHSRSTSVLAAASEMVTQSGRIRCEFRASVASRSTTSGSAQVPIVQTASLPMSPSPTNRLVTRQNGTRQRIRIQSNMRHLHPMMQVCGLVDPLWRSRQGDVHSAAMAGSMPAWAPLRSGAPTRVFGCAADRDGDWAGATTGPASRQRAPERPMRRARSVS
jgi:hypothetical protein